MKKLFTIVTLISFSLTIFSQEKSDNLKNFRFGGTVMPSLNWYKPDDLKRFAGNGSVFKFGVMINGEKSFNGNFALGFGIGLTSAGGKMTFTDTASYYFNDGNLIKHADIAALKGKWDFYKLNNRTYNASYFIIPISLKMRTNEIGYMRYFFQPTFNIAFRKKVRVDDVLHSNVSGQQVNQTDLDISKDMAPIRFSATISAGGEYYVAGTTAITFSIGYDYGLSNVVKTTSAYLIRTDKSGVKQKFTQNGVIITAGILF